MCVSVITSRSNFSQVLKVLYNEMDPAEIRLIGKVPIKERGKITSRKKLVCCAKSNFLPSPTSLLPEHNLENLYKKLRANSLRYFFANFNFSNTHVAPRQTEIVSDGEEKSGKD